jgi:hypothetical protein
MIQSVMKPFTGFSTMHVLLLLVVIGKGGELLLSPTPIKNVESQTSTASNGTHISNTP